MQKISHDVDGNKEKSNKELATRDSLGNFIFFSFFSEKVKNQFTLLSQ